MHKFTEFEGFVLTKVPALTKAFMAGNKVILDMDKLTPQVALLSLLGIDEEREKVDVITYPEKLSNLLSRTFLSISKSCKLNLL